jgi:predicted nucleic acid-binding protein
MLAGMAATGLPKDWRNARPAASLLLFHPFERVIEERWASLMRNLARRGLLPEPQ